MNALKNKLSRDLRQIHYEVKETVEALPIAECLAKNLDEEGKVSMTHARIASASGVVSVSKTRKILNKMECSEAIIVEHKKGRPNTYRFGPYYSGRFIEALRTNPCWPDTDSSSC